MFCGLSGSDPTNRNIAFKVWREYGESWQWFGESMARVEVLIYKEKARVARVERVLVNLV